MLKKRQLSIFFYSSDHFQEFMSIAQRKYKICKDEAVEKRLMSLKNTVVTKIKEQLNAVKNVAYTSVLVIVSI